MKHSNYSEKNLIALSNDLIRQGDWDLSTIQLKIFLILVSCIDARNPRQSTYVSIDKNDLLKAIGMNPVSKGHSYCRKVIESLVNRSITYRGLIDENGDVHDGVISLVTRVDWNQSSNIITCKFEEDIMPFLLGMKNKFTQYPSTYVRILKTKYSILLYQLLRSYYGQGKKEVVITTNELRNITATKTKYEKFNIWENKVLKTSVEDINESHLDILIAYSKLSNGTGGMIKSIRFYIKKREHHWEKSYGINPAIKLLLDTMSKN